MSQRLGDRKQGGIVSASGFPLSCLHRPYHEQPCGRPSDEEWRPPANSREKEPP